MGREREREMDESYQVMQIGYLFPLIYRINLTCLTRCIIIKVMDHHKSDHVNLYISQAVNQSKLIVIKRHFKRKRR